MNHTPLPRRAGFTLLELVIIIALAVGVTVAIGTLIYMFSKISSYEKATSQSSGSASALIREVESLVVPAHAVVQTHAFTSTTTSSSSRILVLEIPSIDSSGVVITNTYDYAVFYTSGTNAYRLLQANALSRRVSGTKQLSSAVSSLTFTYDSGTYSAVSTVTVDIQTQAQVRQDTAVDHRSESIVLRNH